MTERISDLEPLGSEMKKFWRSNDKAVYAKQLAKNRENVFIGQDGLARCKICEAPVMFLLKLANRWLTCPCKCRKREEEKFDRIAELKQYSGLEGIYRKADFDSYAVSKENEAVHSSCLNFAIHFDKVEKQGYGIYLFGESTDEKELLAACVANLLLDAGKQVLFASFEQILSEVKEAYTKRISDHGIVMKYINAELLVLINVGMKKYPKSGDAANFAQAKLYPIVDGRYIRQKPTIFTSNYTLEQLVTERGIMRNTVERIAQMSTRKFELKGKSHRLERVGSIPF